MKRLLANPTSEKKRIPRQSRNSKNNIVGSVSNTSIVEETVTEKEEEKISIPAQGDDVPSFAPVVKPIEEDNIITKEDGIKMLELLRTP